MKTYINPEHTEAIVGKSSGRVEDLIRLGYLKETDVLEPYVEPVPSADEVFTTSVSHFLSGISQIERDTFSDQKSEALQWKEDTHAEVPFIRGLAAARGITMEVLVEKILIKAVKYQGALSLALGTKHKAEDEAGL